MKIKTATINDIDAISDMEMRCFLATEAASREVFIGRLRYYPNHFWLLEDDGVVISCINGYVTDESRLDDDMYEDASKHNENGTWQMIFGVMTLPEYQGNGYASKLMKHVINECKKQGRRGIVLTCKMELVRFYEKFGYVNEGKSISNHGGVVWNEMRLIF